LGNRLFCQKDTARGIKRRGARRSGNREQTRRKNGGRVHRKGVSIRYESVSTEEGESWERGRGVSLISRENNEEKKPFPVSHPGTPPLSGTADQKEKKQLKWGKGVIWSPWEGGGRIFHEKFQKREELIRGKKGTVGRRT